jgi:hypothetical protein
MVQKSYKIFSNDFGKGFWNGMMEGKKMGSDKKDFEVAMFFSPQNIDFPFLFEETFGAFLFFNTFSLSPFFSMHSSIFFKWNGMEWLSHDYENGGVVDITALDAYFGMELCTPVLLGEASKKIWMANYFQKISKLTMDTSLNNVQQK